MKQYPSINKSTGQSFQEFDAHCFEKLDGSNIRVQWTKKKGWHLYGTRRRLFDESDLIFGPSIYIWEKEFAEPIAKIANDLKWPSVVCFAEFLGPNSFAGKHDPNDQSNMELYLIDANVHNIGLLDPRDYLKLFANIKQAKYLGKYRWTRGLVKQVYDGLFEGAAPEGIVGKSGIGEKRIAAKAKTKSWLDKLKGIEPEHEDVKDCEIDV